MNPQSAMAGPHLDDGELLRYLDVEGTGEETRRWDEHLGACPRCRGEAETLRSRSGVVSRWLAATDFETRATPAAAIAAAGAAAAPAAEWPRRREARPRAPMRSGPWLKAAVITLLLAAPLAALPPVRGWIADQVASLRADDPAVMQPAQGPASVDARANVIRFVPAPGGFRVVIDAPQAEGFLRVSRTSGPEAVLEVGGAGVRPEPMVSARGIRIANGEEATASYTLSLPPEVDAVSVDIGGERLQLGARDLAQPITLPLRRPARSGGEMDPR